MSRRADAIAQEGTTKLLEAARSSPENGTEPVLEGAQLLHDAALLRAWQAVRFVSCAAKGQWGINGAFLAPHLLKFLPSLLKLQVRTYSQGQGASHVRRSSIVPEIGLELSLYRALALQLLSVRARAQRPILTKCIGPLVLIESRQQQLWPDCYAGLMHCHL